nr:MAG TPA: ATPase [Caudoviricetes sp.]
MAEEGSLELAPLRAKVVLDLTQFDDGMEQIVDKTDELKDINVPVKINLNNNPEDLEEVSEEIKETAQQTAESFFNILDEVEQADQEILELGDDFAVVGEKIEEVVEYTETMKESIAELQQQVAEVDGHDFIINYNGEQIHAMAQDMEELTNATHVYQDALARLTSEQGEFDERLNLDYYTLEEFETEIKSSTEVLQSMIEESRGLNIDLAESQEALQDNIPLWEDLTEQQQAEFKSVGELEYNLQALQARFLEVSNAIGNLGDAMETATAKQQQFNNAVENSENDVSQYNADAMEYIEAYAQQIETVEESTKANNNNRQSLTASQEAMNDYKEKLIETYQALEREGVRVKKLQTLYKDLTSTQREGVNQFKNDTEALENNLNRVVESYNKLNKAGKLDAQANEELKDTIDELVSASSRLQESLMLDQANFNRTQITAQETGREFNSVTDKAEIASEKTGIMSSNVKSYGESWWTTATMAMMSIQMITSSMGELLQTGAQVELSGIGLTETFGKQGAQAIKNFTQNTNNANLTLQEVLPTAETLGLALRQYGGTKTQIAGVTTQIMNMANQLQLATGGAVSFSEGADAIRQELAGQSYALKSLGINLSNTLLNQTALNSQWHKSYDKLDSYQQAVIKVDALQGQLNKTFGTTSTYLKSQAGQYEKNIAEFKNNMAKLGEDLLPLANAILPSILKIVEKIVSVVDKIKSNQWLVNKIEWLAKVGIKLVEIGVTIAILTKSVITFMEVGGKLTEVISSLDPMGLVILGIIASVVLLYEAWKHNWFNIRGITKKAVDGIEYYWGRCKADTLMIWNGIMTGLRNTWRLLSSEAKQQFNEVINKIKYYWGRCKADTLMIWNGIKNGLVQTWRTLTSEASEQWNMVVNKIKYYCGRCKADTLMIWNGIVSGIIQTITILKDEAIQQWNSIYYGIRQVVEEIKANVINDWDSLKYGVLEVIETLENIIESIWNNIYSFSVNTVQDTVSAVIAEFEGLYDDVVNIFDDIWNTISSIWNDITSKLGSVGGMINNATGGLFMSMPTGFASLPTVNNFSTTNITNTTSTNLSTIQTQTDSLPIQSIPTIGELHIHSPQTLDPLETYNQMQQWSINMANGLY